MKPFLTGRYAGASTSEYYLDGWPLGQQGGPAFNVALEPDNMNVGQVLQDAGYVTGLVGKYHVDQNKDKPFYLHYATTLLHGPNGEWFKSLSKPLVTDEGMLDEPMGLMDRQSVMRRIRKAGLTEKEAGYLWMDDSLGMLLDRLDKHGIADDTIIVFIADHGSVNKGSLMKNRGTEVPCMIRWPAKIKPGVVPASCWQTTDVKRSGRRLPQAMATPAPHS